MRFLALMLHFLTLTPASFPDMQRSCFSYIHWHAWHAWHVRTRTRSD
jgi:hypothetical protein